MLLELSMEVEARTDRNGCCGFAPTPTATSAVRWIGRLSRPPYLPTVAASASLEELQEETKLALSDLRDLAQGMVLSSSRSMRPAVMPSSS